MENFGWGFCPVVTHDADAISFCFLSTTGWGAHYPNYPHGYLTAAAALGITIGDIDTFTARLEKCLKKFCDKTMERGREGDEDSVRSSKS